MIPYGIDVCLDLANGLRAWPAVGGGNTLEEGAVAVAASNMFTIADRKVVIYVVDVREVVDVVPDRFDPSLLPVTFVTATTIDAQAECGTGEEGGLKGNACG